MIRVAVIADIHGDLDALQQVLAAVDGAAIDPIWCLGDIVGLGATAPSEVVDLVRDRCAIALAGNHDRWVTGQLSLSMLPLPRQRAQLQSQNHVLSREQLTWLAALPERTCEHAIEMWHGSAQDPITGWISSPRDAAEHLTRQHTPIGLVGHTHRPLLAETDGTTIHYDEDPTDYHLAGDRCAVFNPGAVLRSRRWLELDLANRRRSGTQADPSVPAHASLRARGGRLTATELRRAVPAGDEGVEGVAVLDVGAGSFGAVRNCFAGPTRSVAMAPPKSAGVSADASATRESFRPVRRKQSETSALQRADGPEVAFVEGEKPTGTQLAGDDRHRQISEA